ncbi:MAG: hypothetical protein J6W75_01170 [Bacteroidaceae bacterium]|nr:hypothetical protein [Bacteroidaceae bacterium]
MNNSIAKRRLVRGASCACAAFVLLGGTLVFSSCQDELLTGMPSWLGSSVYEELENRGNFQQTLDLINDPDLADANYREMLSRTGSMTMFVADDDAWNRYLSKRGFTSVKQLPKSEKKNLLKGAMINNAYLIELLSNLPGDPPTEGACLRRASRVDVLDSIPVMMASEFPKLNPARVDKTTGEQIDYWSAVRDRASIKIFKDNYSTPMVHFLPDFMTKNDLTSEDLMKLSNGKSSDVGNSAYINGLKVVEKDVTCQNGYIHVLEEVPEQLPNMAEIIHREPQMSIFSELLDRFSYPELWTVQVMDGKRDSLFVKRYFNQGHKDNALNKISETGRVVSTTLAMDPGWNRYRPQTGNTDITFQNDGGAMLVPTNEWMEEYLHGEGAAIGAKYGYDWRNVPDDVVLPFLNNCMQNSFTSSTPSKFGSVKNTAAEDMGIVPGDVERCFMACNGVVYQLGKVFVAPEHQSVFFPAVLRSDEDLAIMHQMIADKRYDSNYEQYYWTLNEYRAYVNSMGSTYTLMLPKDAAFASSPEGFNCIDPYSLYEKKPIAYRYYLDGENTIFPVRAQAMSVDTTGGAMVVTDKPATVQPAATASAGGLGLVNNRLQDLLDNLIIVHGLRGVQTFHPDQEIYLNKAGGPIKVRFEGDKVTGIAGSYHASKGWWIPVSEETTFDQRESGNGVSYVLDSIPISTYMSPYSILRDSVAHPDFSAFVDLLVNTDSLGMIDTNVDGHPTMDFAFKTMGNYHYTIYVPTNEAIEGLVNKGWLPTGRTLDAWQEIQDLLDDYYSDLKVRLGDIESQLKNNQLTSDAYEAAIAEVEALEARADSLLLSIYTAKNEIRNVISNFLRYHIQDGSVYLGGEKVNGEMHETAAIDTTTMRFRRLTVDNQAGAIRVTDQAGKTAANVIAGDNSNLMGRQYLFGGSEQGSTRQIFSSSYVVIHQIDRPLVYDDNPDDDDPENPTFQFLPKDFPQPTTPEWLEDWANSRQPNPVSKRR